MQRIIQINIAGRLIPIEEDAYATLKDYISTLERLFAREPGEEEIIEDIEMRIAELFSIRLQSGAHSIVRSDVQKVIETLGTPQELTGNAGPQAQLQTSTPPPAKLPASYIPPPGNNYNRPPYEAERRLYRDPNNKMLGGVCSGIANYFDIDPTIVRFVFAIMVLGMGIGILAYIVGWAVMPIARTPQDVTNMRAGEPMNIHTMSRNMSNELQDLKKRGEEMSRELKDFFSKKK